MGVSGCGKSTVGLALAQRRGVPFLEGDGLHPPSNIAAMAAGIALDDAMRQPWLQSIADRIHDESNGVVASCSALRRTYRDVLRQKGPVVFRVSGNRYRTNPIPHAGKTGALHEPSPCGKPTCQP